MYQLRLAHCPGDLAPGVLPLIKRIGVISGKIAFPPFYFEDLIQFLFYFSYLKPFSIGIYPVVQHPVEYTTSGV